MSRSFLFIIIASACILIVGCTPSSELMQATIEVAIAQTQEASVTDTPAATSTFTPEPTPTNTLTPTSTNTPTATVTNTPTSTSTPTITPTPPGPVGQLNARGDVKESPSDDARTAFFLQVNNDVAIIERNSDSSWLKIFLLSNGKTGWVPAALVDLPEDIVLTDVLVATPSPTPTHTPIPTNTPDVRGEYIEMDIRELDAYPTKYISNKVKLRGQVFNIMSDGLQMWVRVPGGGRFDNVAVVLTWTSDSILPAQVYEDTWIVVYGRAMGTWEGTNAYGATITQPLIYADIIEKQ